jgi:hypothetical protein
VRRGFQVNVHDVRRFALSLPEVTEEPHFHLTSFRVKSKIFATMPAEGGYLNVFVGDAEREVMTAVDPEVFETLRWGKQIAGLKVRLAAAKGADVKELLRAAWQRKAPKKLTRTRTP